MEECGVIYISIHARTTKQLYSGEPRYELLKDLHKYISIPFGISGNIFKVEDAVKALKITGADCVLVARGGVGNPLLIKEINYFVKKGKRMYNYCVNKNMRQKKFCRYKIRLEN